MINLATNRIKRFLHHIYLFLDKKPIAFLIILSLSLNCIIEILGRRSLCSLLLHILTKPHIFLLNTIIVMSTCTISLLVKRRAFTVLIISSLWIICGIVNCAFLSFRTTPFTARDILLAGDGLQIADVYMTKFQIVLVIIALIAFITASFLGFMRMPKCAARLKPTRFLSLLIILALPLLLLTATSAGNAVIPDSYSSVSQAYDDLGFAYCFTNSILSGGISKPDNYSYEAVDEILSVFPTPDRFPSANTNIIFVQLESFVDPAAFRDLNFIRNPVPFFNALKSSYPSGTLTVPVLGGGTANTEFEVLTGMSLNHFGLGEYPYDSVLIDTPCESIAYNLKNLGYATHAIHNHTATFYSRHIVYSNLGFSRFVPLEFMQNVEFTDTGWAKDNILLEHITASLETTPGSDFVFAVTVQGHGKYPENYENTDFGIQVADPFSALDPQSLEYYFRQLNDTDSFIRDLVQYLENNPENVILVLYSDHLPSLPLTAEQLVSESLYSTEYVIWSNFNLAASDKNLSAYELSAYVLDLLDIHEGTLTKLHQYYKFDDKEQAMLMLEYDALFGERFLYNGFLPAPTPMQLGAKPIRITKSYTDTASSYVRGEGFTPFSVIYVNGQRKDTDFLNNDVLRTPYIFAEADIITVVQSGPDRFPLSTTTEYKHQ